MNDEDFALLGRDYLVHFDLSGESGWLFRDMMSNDPRSGCPQDRFNFRDLDRHSDLDPAGSRGRSFVTIPSQTPNKTPQPTGFSFPIPTNNVPNAPAAGLSVRWRI